MTLIQTMFAVMNMLILLLIPWLNDPTYTRDDYRWYLNNNGSPSPLYHDGSLQSTDPGGAADVGAVVAWGAMGQTVGITVGLVDNGIHGERLAHIIADPVYGIASGSTVVQWFTDWTQSSVGQGIYYCTTNGAKVICIAYSTGEFDPYLYGACWFAAGHGVILCCAVPNVAQSIDGASAYPCGWLLPNLIPIGNSTRTDTIFNPSAWGRNVIAAPGRVIVASDNQGNETFATGTSEAAGVATGCIAWLIGKFPNKTARDIFIAVRQSVVPIDSRILGRIDLPRAIATLTAVGNTDMPNDSE